MIFFFSWTFYIKTIIFYYRIIFNNLLSLTYWDFTEICQIKSHCKCKILWLTTKLDVFKEKNQFLVIENYSFWGHH